MKATNPIPFCLRHDLVMQMPHLKKKFLKYDSYKEKTLKDIFTEEELEGTIDLEANQLASSILINKGAAGFEVQPLPSEAQLSTTFGIHAADVSGDEHLDLILVGNFYEAKPEMGRYDASYGVVLEGDGQMGFTPAQGCFKVDGQARDLQKVRVGDKELLLVARNNDSIELFEIR